MPADESGAVGPADAAHAPPPAEPRWGRLYALVIGALAVEIALLRWLTVASR